MTADPFAGVFLDGLPTAADLLALAESQGFAVVVKGGKPALREFRKGGDRGVAAAVAKVLGREPYRTDVLSVASQPAAVAAPPKPEPKPLPPLREEACRVCRALVCETATAVTDLSVRRRTGEVVFTGEVAVGREVLCEAGDCPYPAIREPMEARPAWWYDRF